MEFFLTEKIFTANIFLKKILLAVLPIASFALEERHYLNTDSPMNTALKGCMLNKFW